MAGSTQKWPDNILIVRHGESARNVAKLANKKDRQRLTWTDDETRDMDTPLTLRGIQQAEELGRYFNDVFYNISTVFVSPYFRAQLTAKYIFEHYHTRQPKVVTEDRVREIEFGELDGLTAKGWRQKFPDEWARRQKEGKYWFRPRGGESRADVADRVRSFLGTLTRDYRRTTVLIVCHSEVVVSFRRLLERWDEAQYLKADKEEDVRNCSYTHYQYDESVGKLVLRAKYQCCGDEKPNGS